MGASTTIAGVAIRVRNRLTERGEAETGISLARIKAMIPEGLVVLARQKAAHPSDYKDFQKTSAITVATGEVDMAAVTSLLFNWLVSNSQLVLGGKAAKWVETYEELDTKRPKDIYWAAPHGTKIVVKAITTGLLGTAAVTGTLTACHVLTLAELKDNYIAELVDVIVSLIVAGGRGESPAPPSTANLDTPKTQLEVT